MSISSLKFFELFFFHNLTFQSFRKIKKHLYSLLSFYLPLIDLCQSIPFLLLVINHIKICIILRLF